jgi:hypothetical protein
MSKVAKKCILGVLMVGIKDAGKLVVVGEVNRQIQIYFRQITKLVDFVVDMLMP